MISDDLRFHSEDGSFLNEAAKWIWLKEIEQPEAERDSRALMAILLNENLGMRMEIKRLNLLLGNQS